MKYIRVGGRKIRIVPSSDVQARLQGAYFLNEDTLVVYNGLSREQQERAVKSVLSQELYYNERVERKYFPGRTRFRKRRGPKRMG